MIMYKLYKKDCAPCYALTRLITRMILPKDMEIISLDVSKPENKEFADAHGVTKVPTLVIGDRKLEGLPKELDLIKFIFNT